MISCDKSITFEYYSGCGPGCYLYSHGSFLPVTEGYKTLFAPIFIEEKVWIQMNCKIGPGVTIGQGSILMPGTVVLENIPAQRLVVGDPAKLTNIPLLKTKLKQENLEKLSIEILAEYCKWSNEFEHTNWSITNGSIQITARKKKFTISTNGEGDIVLSTQNMKIKNRMYFDFIRLRTDKNEHPIKQKLEHFMRLYYGLTFLTDR